MYIRKPEAVTLTDNGVVAEIVQCYYIVHFRVSWAVFVLSLSLTRALPVYSSPPVHHCNQRLRCFSVTPVLTCLITFSLLLASVSPCSLSDYFACTWVMLVCYAIYMNIYPVLSCLIKSRGVALVLCAFVSLSSCCMWPRTRTVFLPYEKFQLCYLSSRQESSFTEEFIYFVFVPVLCLCSTDCLF